MICQGLTLDQVLIFFFFYDGKNQNAGFRTIMCMKGWKSNFLPNAHESHKPGGPPILSSIICQKELAQGPLHNYDKVVSCFRAIGWRKFLYTGLAEISESCTGHSHLKPTISASPNKYELTSCWLPPGSAVEVILPLCVCLLVCLSISEHPHNMLKVKAHQVGKATKNYG